MALNCIMKRKARKATKRRIPREPGKPKCKFTFEVDGEVVIMKVDCLCTCHGNEMPKDVCWSNLVKAISGSALPDRIMLCGERVMICDRILVSLLRNASLLVRRISFRLDEIRRIPGGANSAEADRLADLMRALLYDIPQLIRRDFRGKPCEAHATKSIGHVSSSDEFAAAADILTKKAITNFDPLGSAVSEKVSS